MTDQAVVYGKANCVYCDRAKRLLENLDIFYVYKDVGAYAELKEELLELVPMAKSVPQIWVNDTYVGGYDDLVTYISRAVETVLTARSNWEDGAYGQGRL